MLWKQYEKKIVKRLGVRLVGWPSGLPFDVEKLKEDELNELKRALNDGSCRWEEVPVEEIDVRLSSNTPGGDQPRKTRTDAGKKRSSTNDVQRATKRRKHVPDDGSDDDSASCSDSEEACSTDDSGEVTGNEN